MLVPWSLPVTQEAETGGLRDGGGTGKTLIKFKKEMEEEKMNKCQYKDEKN